MSESSYLDAAIFTNHVFLLSSAWDKRNDIMKAFDDPKWKMLFVDTDSVAKGTWSPPTDDGAMQAGFRRYGASKLCQIMMM